MNRDESIRVIKCKSKINLFLLIVNYIDNNLIKCIMAT